MVEGDAAFDTRLVRLAADRRRSDQFLDGRRHFFGWSRRERELGSGVLEYVRCTGKGTSEI